VTSSRQCPQPLALARAPPSPVQQQRPVGSPAHSAGTPTDVLGPQQTVTPAEPLPRVCVDCRTADTRLWWEEPVTGIVMCNTCYLDHDNSLQLNGFHFQPLQLADPAQVRLGLSWSIRTCISCMYARS